MCVCMPIINERFQLIAEGLNCSFERGGFAFDYLDYIRELPYPIIMDVEGTLISHRSLKGSAVKPEAQDALRTLASAGSIFFVSKCRYRDWLNRELMQHGLFQTGAVLMAEENWVINSSGKQTSAYPEIEKFARRLGMLTETALLYYMVQNKRLAPLFMRTYDVPLIDDDNHVTRENLGLRVYRVDHLIYDPEKQKPLVESNKGVISLTEAAADIERYYQDIRMYHNR